MRSVLGVLESDRMVAVVRAPEIKEPGLLATALVAGGIRSVEFTCTTPGVDLVIQQAIAEEPEAMIGAGTVLTSRQAHLAVDAGALYIVTPAVIPEVAEAARERDVPFIMGAMTPTEVWAAIGLGATAVKVFPASTVGPEHIAAIRAVFPQVRILASGGIVASSARSFLQHGAFAVAVGSTVVSAASIQRSEWGAITERARHFASALDAGA